MIDNVLSFPSMYDMLRAMLESWKSRCFDDDRLSDWRRMSKPLYGRHPVGLTKIYQVLVDKTPQILCYDNV